MQDLPTTQPILPSDVLPPPRYRLIFTDKEQNIPATAISTEFSENNPYLATVLENSRITATNHFQDVRHLVLESNLQYEPGDVCSILPKNIPSIINRILKRFNLQADQSFRIDKIDPDAPSFPNKIMTWYELFESCLDIAGTPRRYFFELLSMLCEDEDEKDRLQWFGSADGVEDLYRYNQREKRMYVEVFEDFKTIQLGVDRLCYLLDLIPPIKPRYFSIASYNKQRIELCVAIVKFLTPYKRIRTGVCTSYIKELVVGDSVKIWVKKGTMEFPKESNVPMIMVGPGTGLAPFRSLLQHHTPTSPTILFFGCRYQQKDFLYGSELESLREPFILSVAFSRDQENKIYVQHRIREMSEIVWSIISSGGRIYVAGNNRMPKYVREAFIDVVKKKGNLSDKDAEEYINTLERNKKYQVESW